MKQREFAKALRKNMTDAEHRLWRYLRGKRLGAAKFRRQHPLGPYVVDFVELKHKIVVEADGGQHNECHKDAERDAWLAQQGFRVLRFWNDDILLRTDLVLDEIYRALCASPSPRPSPSRGEGALGATLRKAPRPNSPPELRSSPQQQKCDCGKAGH